MDNLEESQIIAYINHEEGEKPILIDHYVYKLLRDSAKHKYVPVIDYTSTASHTAEDPDWHKRIADLINRIAEQDEQIALLHAELAELAHYEEGGKPMIVAKKLYEMPEMKTFPELTIRYSEDSPPIPIKEIKLIDNNSYEVIIAHSSENSRLRSAPASGEE